jgi:hypothetical protein
MKFPIYASAGVLVTLASFGSASTAANAASHSLAASPPKFYIETGIAPHGAAKRQNVVRATATGAITGTVRCPWAKSVEEDVAAADQQTFFISCIRIAAGPKQTITGTRIFRFRVTAAGRTTGYSPVPGGEFHGDADGLAASANGAALAVDVPVPSSDETVVINAKTGAHAIWRGGVMPGGAIFTGGRPSLTADGKELAVFGRAHCPKEAARSSCKSPGEEMRVMNPASAGGKLASGRMVFKQSQVIKPTSEGFINDAFINSGGTTVTAGVVFGGGLTGSFVEVLSVSVATGKPLRTEFKLNTGNGFFYRFVDADPSGQWVLFDAGRSSPNAHAMNGWVDHGKLLPLKPVGDNVFDEVWSS